MDLQETAATVAQRRQDLYGADRNKFANQIRDTLRQSHVLQGGQYNIPQDKLKDEIWKTTTSVDYTHTFDKPKFDTSRWIQQMDTHFQLGNDSGHLVPQQVYQTSAMKDDFNEKALSKPGLIKEDKTVNWSDMAPQYAEDRTTGSTEYSSVYKESDLPSIKAPLFPRINTCKVELPSLQRKAKGQVNVKLGSDPDSYVSETQTAYSLGGPQSQALNSSHPQTWDGATMMQRLHEAKKVTSFMREMGRNSSVFRPGDYNNIKQEAGSIFTLDYCKKTSTARSDRLLPLTGLKHRHRDLLQQLNTNASSLPVSHGDGEPCSERTAAAAAAADVDTKDTEKSKEKGDINIDDDDDEETYDHLHPKTPGLINRSLHTTIVDNFKDSKAGKEDHTSAHFMFGSDSEPVGSIYAKDFNSNSSRKTLKPIHFSAPKDSQVLQDDPQRKGQQTTVSADYGAQTFKMAMNANAEVQRKAQFNMARRHGNNVVLSYDPQRHLSDRQTSLSHTSYVPPPADFTIMPARRAPLPQYNYLETDVALPFTVPTNKMTENQYNFRGLCMDEDSSLQRRKTKDDQTKTRLAFGRNTHFIFGYDNQEFDSEQRTQFQGKRTDPALPPAGKTESIPEFHFSHINISENTQDMRPNPCRTSIQEPLVARQRASARELPTLPVHQASIMKNDYQPLANRIFTPAQLMTLKQSDILQSKSISNSHFFHMDSRNGNNMETTTMADFVKPETVMSARQMAAVH